MSACKVFISHSSEDVPIVRSFVDNILIGTFLLDHSADDIFCTSLPGMSIEPGEQWREEIKRKLSDAEVVFFIITPNFKSSEVCLNEMGAAWVMCDYIIPLIVDPIKFDQIGALINVKQGEKLLSETGLDRVKGKLHKLLGVDSSGVKDDYWTEQKKKLIKDVEEHIKNNPFPLPVSKDTIENLQRENCMLESELEVKKVLSSKLIKENENLLSRINALELIKDAETVKEVNISHGVLDNLEIEYKEFEDLIKEVINKSNSFKPVIRTLIYSDFTGNKLMIDSQFYSAEIMYAMANGIIDDDCNIEWSSIKAMRDLNDALCKLKSFYEQASSDLINKIENDYPEANYDFDCLSFWEDVIGMKMDHD